MGKVGGTMTTKAISKMIKSKGLQKLRWYCQVCSKQCRDDNGFKCHLNSESHQRMIKVFSQNSRYFMDQYSKEFEKTFLGLLKARWRFKRVKANKVYNEHIKDRNHVHMNSTNWTTLTQFVYHLQETGKVVADETEEGLFITYIDDDPDTKARILAKEKAEKMMADDELTQEKRIKKQMKIAQSIAEEASEKAVEEENDQGEAVDTDKPEKVVMSIKAKKPKLKLSVFDDGDAEEGKKKKKKKRTRIEGHDNLTKKVKTV